MVNGPGSVRVSTRTHRQIQTNFEAWLQGNTTTVSLALTLVPFAGIAFLWFMGVVRDRLGTLEDQFFSTVFFGSGLLFLAMIFAFAARAGGIISSYAIRVSDHSLPLHIEKRTRNSLQEQTSTI